MVCVGQGAGRTLLRPSLSDAWHARVVLLPRRRECGLGHLTGLCPFQTIRTWTPGRFRTSGWRTLTITQPICGRLLLVARLSSPADKPDRFFRVIKFWMDATSDIALELKTGVPAIKSLTRKAEFIDCFTCPSRKRMKTS